MTADLLKQLIELGWPAIVLLGYSWLAREYIRSRNDEIQHLRDEVKFLQQVVAVNHEELAALRLQSAKK